MTSEVEETQRFVRAAYSPTGVIGLKREQKEAVFCSCRRILSNPALPDILNRFTVKMYLFFRPKSGTEILKLIPERWHASELAASVPFFDSEKTSSVLHLFDST